MKSLRLGVLAGFLTLALAVPAAFAAQQSQTQQQDQQQTQTQTQQQSQQQTQAQTQTQPTQPQQQAAPPAPTSTDANAQQSSTDKEATPKDVKAGTENDVNAIGNRKVGGGVNLYSIEREIALGKGAAQEVEKAAKLVDDPVVVEYVNRVGQNLVRNSDCKVPFTIKVIDSDEINAFALPGGFFYVNSGLILRADEEAELAGVMGHEIAHVCARHGTRNATKGQIMEWASIPLILLGPGGWAGYGLYEGMNMAIPLTYLKFSRDAEREADFLGLQYMYKAGYDPNAFVSFFEKIQAEEKRHPGSIPKVFSTHPPTPDRVKAAQNEIATILPVREQYIVTTSEFDTVKDRLYRIENRNRLNDKKNGGPTLRSKTEQKKQGTDANGDDTDPDKPVLKKRPDGPGGPGGN